MTMPAQRMKAGGLADDDGAVIESAHCFGPGLVGVLTRPRGGAVRHTGVILYNAGLVHRVGPFRGYVQLARMLADRGFPVLRFDQSGLGDSPASQAVSAMRRRLEANAAMTLLMAETGAERFVLGGICSGADDAFHIAATDPRVRGLLLLDGLAYPTPGYWWRYLLPRLLDLPKLWQLLRGIGANEPGMEDYRDFPSRSDAVRQLAEIVARDVRVLFLFTGGAYRYFNHRQQLAACLGAAAHSPQVSLEYWPDCDHTFYLRRDRARLHQAVASWMRAQFDDAGGTAS